MDHERRERKVGGWGFFIGLLPRSCSDSTYSYCTVQCSGAKILDVRCLMVVT